MAPRRRHVARTETSASANSSTELQPTAWQQTIGDCVATCIWTSSSSVIAEVAQRLSPLTGINELQLAIGLLTLGLALLAPVCSALWGAMINPNGPIAMICLGKGNTAANLLRMGGQLVGAALGSLLAITFVPVQHKGKFHLLSGKLQEGVALEWGFVCEAALVFLLTIVFLYMTSTSHKNTTVVALAPHLTTVFVCMAGAQFTGPSLNPYLSFVWNLVYQQQTLIEHVVVFWLGPLVGTLAAAFLWRNLAASGPTERRSSKSRAAGRTAAKAIQRAKQKQS